jgi:pyridoxamine 5'-phosphate oxidase
MPHGRGRRWIVIDADAGPQISEITAPDLVPPLVLDGAFKLPRGKRLRKALLSGYLAASRWYSIHEQRLDEASLNADPIQQFRAWLNQARVAQADDPAAMTLATVGPEGQPSARVVLLKDVNEDGFVFFTNYKSQKGRELGVNARAALVFYWPQLHRQVRVTGRVAKTPVAESEAYFQSRLRRSQLSAWASWQSSTIADRQFLEARVRKLEARYPAGNLPLPPAWGGYRLRPESIEFWQGREDRLHERLRYTRQPGGRWRIDRLAP